MTPRQFAVLIDRPLGTVKRWLHEGLPHTKYGGRVVLEKRSAIAWVKTHATPTIWDRITKGPGCWRWNGALDSRGHATLWLDGKMQKAHRVVWELLVGPIPKGAQLRSRCETRGCTNPGCHFITGAGDRTRTDDNVVGNDVFYH